MDYLLHFTPEIIRTLSTAVIVKAATKDCAPVTCAPALTCAAPINSQFAGESGYTGFTLTFTFLFGILFGVSAYHTALSYRHKSPSAATIALRKIA